MDKNDTKGKKNEDSAKPDTVQNPTKQNNTGNKDAKKDEVAILKERIEELENQNKRVLADYRNLEKRIDQERGEWILKANRSLLLNLLPVLDTLILANKHSKSKDQNVSLSIQQFLDILKREGVVKIETAGKVFDPLVMECVETRVGEDWKVLEEARSGYRLGDMILRPALVVVGKKGDSETSSE